MRKAPEKPKTNDQIFDLSGTPLMVIGRVGEELLVDRWTIVSKDGVPGVIFWSFYMECWVLL